MVGKMKAIDNKELILALEELEKEKGIKKEYLLESIETALVTAYKRNFDALENVKVVMDKQTGATHVYSVKEVMKNPAPYFDIDAELSKKFVDMLRLELKARKPINRLRVAIKQIVDRITSYIRNYRAISLINRCFRKIPQE